MKIKSIRAVNVDLPYTGAKAQPTGRKFETARRPSWVEHGSVANPVTRYPRYAAFRPSWLPTWENFGCLIEAEDGTWGFAIANHGKPVAALIDDYFGPRLEGENCMAVEKVYDMAVRKPTARPKPSSRSCRTSGHTPGSTSRTTNA